VFAHGADCLVCKRVGKAPLDHIVRQVPSRPVGAAHWRRRAVAAPTAGGSRIAGHYARPSTRRTEVMVGGPGTRTAPPPSSVVCSTTRREHRGADALRTVARARDKADRGHRRLAKPGIFADLCVQPLPSNREGRAPEWSITADREPWRTGTGYALRERTSWLRSGSRARGRLYFVNPPLLEWRDDTDGSMGAGWVCSGSTSPVCAEERCIVHGPRPVKSLKMARDIASRPVMQPTRP
jgi:hypothetical protein